MLGQLTTDQGDHGTNPLVGEHQIENMMAHEPRLRSLVDQPQGRPDLVQPRGLASWHALGIGEIEQILVPSPAHKDLALAVDRQQLMAHDVMRRTEDGGRVDEGAVEIRQEQGIVAPGAVAQPGRPGHSPGRVCDCRPRTGRRMRAVRWTPGTALLYTFGPTVALGSEKAVVTGCVRSC